MTLTRIRSRVSFSVSPSDLLDADFYVSKSGNDSNDGLTAETAKLTLSAGLGLLTPDSNEVVEIIGGTTSSPHIFTGGHTLAGGSTLQAIPGTVLIRDGNSSGQSVMILSNDNSSMFGIIIDSAVNVAASGVKLLSITGDNATIQQCGFEGPSTATAHHKHFFTVSVGGTGHLIEDNWWFGEGRYLINIQSASGCTIRGNIGRHDGKQIDAGEPHATFSHYNCDDMIWENNLSLDYDEPDSAMTEGGCFKMSSLSSGSNQNTDWFGNISCFRDPNTSNNRGIHFDAKSGTTVSDIVVKDFYVNFTDATGMGIVWTSLYNGNATATNYTRNNGASDGQPTADGLCDIDAYYVEGVKQAGTKWDNYKNWAVIWARMKAYDVAGDGVRGCTGNASLPNLENYVKGV